MIQPVNALTPQAKYRGRTKTNGLSFKNNVDNSKVALINAGGVSALIGGITTLLARRYTPNWTNALIMGLGGSCLTMFFMAPQILAASNYRMPFKKNITESVAKEDSIKIRNALKDHLKTTRKTVHFKQQA